MPRSFNNYLKDEAGWADYTSMFQPGAVNPSSAPAFAAFGANGMYALLFAEGDIAFIDFHIQHDIKVNSDVYPHIHFSPSTTMTIGQTIIWTIEYASADRSLGESFTGVLTPMTLTYTADGTEVAGEHLVVECEVADAIAVQNVDSMMKLKVTLGTGTYAGDVFAHTADLHYQLGRLSTTNKEFPFV